MTPGRCEGWAVGNRPIQNFLVCHKSFSLFIFNYLAFKHYPMSKGHKGQILLCHSWLFLGTLRPHPTIVSVPLTLALRCLTQLSSWDTGAEALDQ